MNRLIPLLLQWYKEVRKPLPWRDEPTPYRVWISEIMLQQTRIEAVIPYYHRFLAELPDVYALAEVSDERLMKLWEGLGYYSRARNLKKAAKIITECLGGELPRSAEELRTLPGIGDYTAGAIASIAFGEPEPAVDGNVLRAVSRITASSEDISLDRTKKNVREMLRAVYPSGENAGLLTQSLMELGETVCLPAGTPKCADCPVKESCLAFRDGRTADFPVRSGKKARRIEQRTVLLLCCDGRYGIRKRPSGGLLAEMWEYPNLDGHAGTEEISAAVRSLGLSVTDIRPAGTAKHIFTHLEWHMTVYALTVMRTAAEDPGLVWASPAELRTVYAMPGAFKTVLPVSGS